MIEADPVAIKLMSTGHRNFDGFEKTIVDEKEQSSKKFCHDASTAEKEPRWSESTSW